jgi:hypothetical protein
MPEFRRPYHRSVARLLGAFDAGFLERAGCYFGGGTQIALALAEFRESRDIDFLCSRRDGFRLLREAVDEHSLGALLSKPVALAREVRADRDGIRTFLCEGEARVKLEIVFEARIEVSGALDRRLGVPALGLDAMVAEKFLANADRGLDESSASRDMIDLAFLAAARGAPALEPGYRLAETAYGRAVARYTRLVLDKFAAQRRYAAQCARALGVDDTAKLRKGLGLLRAFAPPAKRGQRGA